MFFNTNERRLRSYSTEDIYKKGTWSWNFLIKNLQRVIFDMYCTCELDESVVECQEVIQILEKYLEEFNILINVLTSNWKPVGNSFLESEHSNFYTLKDLDKKRRQTLPVMNSISDILSDHLFIKALINKKYYCSEVYNIEKKNPSNKLDFKNLAVNVNPEELERIQRRNMDLSKDEIQYHIDYNIKHEENCNNIRNFNKVSHNEKFSNSSLPNISSQYLSVKESEVSELKKNGKFSLSYMNQKSLDTLDFKTPLNKNAVDDEGWEIVRNKNRNKNFYKNQRSLTVPVKNKEYIFNDISGFKNDQKSEYVISTKSLPILPCEEKTKSLSNSEFEKLFPGKDDIKLHSFKFTKQSKQNKFNNAILKYKNNENLLISKKKKLLDAKSLKNSSHVMKKSMNKAEESFWKLNDIDNESLLDEEEIEKHNLALENANQEEKDLEIEILKAKSNHYLQYEKESYVTIDTKCNSFHKADMLFVGQKIPLATFKKFTGNHKKKNEDETLQKCLEKQEKAEKKRLKLQEEKSQKLRELSKKIDEVKETKEKIKDKIRQAMNRKQMRAEEKRQKHLQERIRKAHDEEEKAKEIAFINELEAQNKWHDIMDQHQNAEARLADLLEERQQKLEARAAKEAAVEERRKLLEAERLARMAELMRKHQKRQEKWEKETQEREKERLEAAKEKARDREVRLSAIQAAHQANMEELQKKIQDKQEKSAKRHEKNMEQIRQKALESRIMRFNSMDDTPPLALYEKQKMCTLCNTFIKSDIYLLSHLRGPRHQKALKELYASPDNSTKDLLECSLIHIIDAPIDHVDPYISQNKEKQKICKKRCKRLKQKIISSYESSQHSIESVFPRTCITKILESITHLNGWNDSKCLPENSKLELCHLIIDISHILNKNKFPSELSSWEINVLISVLFKLAKHCPTVDVTSYEREFLTITNSVLFICEQSSKTCIIQPLEFCMILELLSYRLQYWQRICEFQNEYPVDFLSFSLFKILNSKAIIHLVKYLNKHDFVSYFTSLGIIESCALSLNFLQQRQENTSLVCDFTVCVVEFFKHVLDIAIENFHEKQTQKDSGDGTCLFHALKTTELVGTVPVLYGMLFPHGVPLRPGLNNSNLKLTESILEFWHKMALLNLNLLQSILGDEGISLQFRHIVSFLLRYCSARHVLCQLLCKVITIIGYFTVANRDNQALMQAGHMPTVLQQLCRLPIRYFSDPSLSALLIPTLLSCCFNNESNRCVIEQEMSYELLEDFLNSPETQSIHLVMILKHKNA